MTGPGRGRRCLIAGAYGFIGSAVARAFQRDGWEVIGVGRDDELGRRLLPEINWQSVNFNHPLDPDVWRDRLNGIDTLVNCVGILQTGNRDRAQAIHVDAPAALFEGARRAGVRRAIHLSAMSAETEIDTEYTRTKLAAEQCVAGLDLDWLILKPSLVIGPGSYGGTSMVRGLAGLPMITPLPDGGTQIFQPIALSDLASGMARLACEGAPSRMTLYAPGPEVMTLAEVVAETKVWLGFEPTRQIAVGSGLTRALLKLGDLWVDVGNRTSLCTTSFRHMAYSEVLDPRPFATATGIRLQSFKDAMAATPATIQDRIHARVAWPGFALRLLLALQLMFGGVPLPGILPDVIQLLLGVAQVGAGFMLLLDRWVRMACLVLLCVLAMALLVSIPFLFSSPFMLLQFALQTLVTAGVAAVVMALAEKR